MFIIDKGDFEVHLSVADPHRMIQSTKKVSSKELKNSFHVPFFAKFQIEPLTEIIEIHVQFKCNSPTNTKAEVEDLTDLMSHLQSVNFDSLVASDTQLVTLKTSDGVELKACKEVLAAHSTVFESMFKIDMEEAASDKVEIIDFSGRVMKELLKFLYYGKVSEDLEDFDVELYHAAKVYDIDGLPEICYESIYNNLNAENVFKIVSFANLYDLDFLFYKCCWFIKG